MADQDFNMTDPMSKYQWDGHSPNGLSYDGVSPPGWSFDGKSPAGYSFDGTTPAGYSDPKIAELNQFKDQVNQEGLPPINDMTAGSSTAMPSFTSDSQNLGNMDTGMPFPQKEGRSIFEGPRGPGMKPTIFGIPTDELTRTLGTIAGALAPHSPEGRVGGAMAQLVTQEKSEEERKRHLDMQGETLKMNQEYKSILGESNQLKLKKMIQADSAKKAEGEALGRLVNAIPGTPEFELAKVDYLKALTNPDKIPPGLAEKLFGAKSGTNKESFKTPLPTTDKGYTISANAQGVTVARKQENGKITEEPYDPAKHGQAVQTAETQMGALKKEGLLTTEEADTVAKKIAKGEAFPADISYMAGAFGDVGNLNRAKIAKAMIRVAPDFNWRNADILKKYLENPQVFMGIVNVNAVRPRVEALREKFKDIKNLDVMPVNEAKNAIKRMFGDPGIADFDSTRTQVVFELQRALTGIGMMSDSRVQQELKNLDRSYSPGQMNKSIDAINEILDTRLGALYQGPIPGKPAIPGDKSQHDSLINTSAKKYNLDPELVKAVIGAESTNDSKAVSPKGAQGLMQLMPGTAKQYGVKDPFDPAQNIEGGTKYLADLMKKHNGNQTLALAEYNGGKLPKETLNYIRKIDKTLEARKTASGKTLIKTGKNVVEVE